MADDAGGLRAELAWRRAAAQVVIERLTAGQLGPYQARTVALTLAENVVDLCDLADELGAALADERRID